MFRNERTASIVLLTITACKGLKLQVAERSGLSSSKLVGTWLSVNSFKSSRCASAVPRPKHSVPDLTALQYPSQKMWND